MKTVRIFLALLIFTLMFAQTVFSWGSRKTLKELVNSAPLIVSGKVLEVKPQVEKYLGQDNFIMTYVKLSVQNFIKGNNAEPILTIKIPGGQIGDRAIGGELSFKFMKDEEALLFLTPMDKNYYEIYGISGKLSVEKKVDGEYLDCSLLKEDEISEYGPDSTFKFENIVSRIEGYLAEKGGEIK